MTIYSQCIPTGNNDSPYVQYIHFCGDVHIEDFVFFQEDGEVKFIYQDPANTCLSLMAEILMPSSLDMYVYPNRISKLCIFRIQTCCGFIGFALDIPHIDIFKFLYEYLMPAIKKAGKIKDKHECYVLLRRSLDDFDKHK